MSVCELFATPDVEMYFYEELDPVDRARVERHLRGCEPCRQRLADLHAIRRALASRPAVDAPSAGDWSGFMRRLDHAVAGTVEPSHHRTVEPKNRRTLEPWNLRTLLPLAAVLALVTMGVLAAARFRPAPVRVAVTNPVVPVVEAPVPKAAAARPDRALREGSAELLERSKLVVLGLATRDPHTRSEDWQYERALAGTLLTDTRLYRQAAIRRGAPEVERVMRDLETVLLEASMSDKKDRAALERVQRLIAKRDLVVKMQVMATPGPAGD
jgi:putative zinc finger protein